MPMAQSIPGVLAGGSYPSRWTPDEARTAGSASVMPRIPSELAATPDSPVKPMMPLGQFRDTFIIAVDSDGIAIIDQHVAHERVLFERVMERLSRSEEHTSELQSRGHLVCRLL